VNTQVTTGPPPPSISINLTDSSGVIAGAGPDPVNPGGLLTYKILVQNNATTRADDVSMVNGTQGPGGGQHHDHPGSHERHRRQQRRMLRNRAPGPLPGPHPQSRRHDPLHDHRQVVASAGSTLFDTATVTGNVRTRASPAPTPS
jgi:hypothetical protein